MTDVEFYNRYGGVWGEYPEYPVVDWIKEVVDKDTRLGYWGWVRCMVEDEAESAFTKLEGE